MRVLTFYSLVGCQDELNVRFWIKWGLMDHQAARQHFGNTIRDLRQQKGITQEQLAEFIGKTTEHISFLERGELLKRGRRGDNLTPHHVPSNAFMQAKVPGYTKDKGIAIMMEHLSPGMGGRHRQTLSYGKSPDLNLSPRQTLAREVWDVRSIYRTEKLYTWEIKHSLQKVIRQNKSTWQVIFKK